MLDVVLAASGVLAVGVAVLSPRLQRWSVSPPLLGLVTGALLGPVIGVISVEDGVEVMHLASRLLLAVALMAIALRYPISAVRQRAGDVALLLAVVLPVMASVMALGTMLSLGVPFGIALVIGAALSPTDPVLASGITTGAPAEQDIAGRDRQILSLESGANDGLAMPLAAGAIAIAVEASVGVAVGRGLFAVLVAVGTGAVLGSGAGRLMAWAERRREIGASVRALYPLVLAALTLGAAHLLGGNDLLAVFVAGLFHNRMVTGGDREVEVGIDETLNQFLVVPVFVLFGAVLPWRGWMELGAGGPAIVLVALFLRRLPVILALHRPLHTTWPETVWLGWFGPIGVAALYYLGHAHTEGVTDPRVWATGTLVVAVSTVVHGLTASPGRVAYRELRTSRDVTAG